MVSEEKIIEEKKEKLKNLFVDKNRLILLAILIFAFAIRLYYFFLTKNQPLWWDEADYMAYAKNLAGIENGWIVTPPHNSIFPFIVSLFFRFGFSEVAIRFLVAFIPSIVLVLVTYFLCIELFEDKRIALISTFLMGVFWEIIFWSMRFHLEGPALILGFLSIYVVRVGYEKRKKIFSFINANWAVPIAAILAVLTYGMRRGYFVFGVFLVVYIFSTKRFKEIIKDKYNWIGVFLGFAILLFLEKFIFVSPITSVAGGYYGSKPFSLAPFGVFPAFFDNIFNPISSVLLYLFWIGFMIVMGQIALSFGHIKGSSNDSKGTLMAFITIAVTLSYFLFYQRQSVLGEARWYYPLLIGSFVCVSKGTLIIVDYAKKYKKILGIVILIGLLAFGGYYELKHANFIIKNKMNSYNGIKEASLFVKDLSSPGDIILATPLPQASYYAEREILHPVTMTNDSNPDFQKFLSKLKLESNARYLIITFSEPYPDWLRKETFVKDQNGQVRYATWEIPFMDSTLDFINNKQDIKESKTYDGITFKLLTVKDDAFVYEIERT